MRVARDPLSADDRLVVALVRGVHGLRGAVRVEVLTDRPAERFAPGAILRPEGRDEPLTVAAAEEIPDGPGWRLRFREISDRTAADGLRGAYLEAPAGPAEALPRGSYYWHEVIGASVRDLADREIGTVVDVYRVGGAEVFVVRGDEFGEFDVPAVRAFIRIFAPKRGEIVVDVDALALEPAPPPRPPRPPRTPRSNGTSRKGGPRHGVPPGGPSSPPTGGSAAQPSGGSATPPTGGSATQPSGGSATQPSGGSATPPSGGPASPLAQD
ncbi:MAG: ribosome maturation factor RimM [Candidatus Limnocylindrales bacterium]